MPYQGESFQLTSIHAIGIDMVELDLVRSRDLEEDSSRVPETRPRSRSIRPFPMLPQEKLVVVVETAEEDGVLC